MTERKRILGTYLRPAREDDAVDQHERGLFIERAKVKRAEVQRYFDDMAEWHRLHPNAEPIDADPDGLMAQLARELDEFIIAAEARRPM